MPLAMFKILTALADRVPFGEALAAGGEHGEDFQYWFREWAGDGIFVDVVVSR